MPGSRLSLASFGCRDGEAAARTATWITGSCACITALFALVSPASGVPGWFNVTAPAALLAITVALLVTPVNRAGLLCLLIPLVGVLIVAGSDVATHDATASGQAFFFLPVLYAASQLRRAGSITVTLAALAGTAIVSLTQQTTVAGLTDIVFLGATLMLTAIVLEHASRLHDRLAAQLRVQAAIDSLTGLVTRRVLDDATHTAIASAIADTGTALILIDVDRFKMINDTYGHPAGDEALIHLATILRDHSRNEDVIARMGGDELAVLMPGCSYPAALSWAEKLVRTVHDSRVPLAGTDGVALSISAGVAHVPEHADDVRDLYASADRALYQAKRNGRGQVGRLQGAPRPASVAF